jgi:predicted nucleotidyltransferase
MIRHQLHIPQEELAEICRRYGVARLSLFGSVLTDGFGPESDVDMLVEFRPEARIGLFEMSAMEEELTELLGRKVDLNGNDHVLALNDVQIIRHEMNLKQKIINLIADPNISYLLLMAGILGLYMEFSHPGTFFPGVAGAICLLLAFTSFQLLPINYAGLLLVLLGIAQRLGITAALYGAIAMAALAGIGAMPDTIEDRLASQALPD